MTSVRNIPDVEPSPPSAADNAVLDAARSAILAVGWRRTTLTDVARRAGVSRMTLYRRWPDMPALLGDLLTREWGTTLTAVVVDVETPTRTGLVHAVTTLVQAVRDDELFTKIVEVDPELLLPYLLVRRGRSQQLLLDRLEPLLAVAQAAGEVRAGDPAVIARGLVLAAHGYVVSAHTMTDRTVPLAALEVELGHLVDGYLRP
ncbi:MAG: TetR family transcriptional regulator [Nocardioidaceae bacterium]|nr:TetR family transcriptional regulator [Nocardioidaceae bacterium]